MLTSYVDRGAVYRFFYLLILRDPGFCEPCNSYSEAKKFSSYIYYNLTIWGIFCRNPTTDHVRGCPPPEQLCPYPRDFMDLSLARK